MKKPYLSIVVPIHQIPNRDFFLGRLQDSLEMQSFRDFEVVITENGRMAENTNSGIRKAKGDLIKVLFMDDYLSHEDSLQTIVNNFALEDHWLVTGCIHDDGKMVGMPHVPTTEGLKDNVNTIGSPSTLTFRNEKPLFFDEKMSWMLDVDYYKRMLALYGEPVILSDLNVIIGIHKNQMSNILTDEEKLAEELYIKTN